MSGCILTLCDKCIYPEAAFLSLSNLLCLWIWIMQVLIELSQIYKIELVNHYICEFLLVKALSEYYQTFCVKLFMMRNGAQPSLRSISDLWGAAGKQGGLFSAKFLCPWKNNWLEYLKVRGIFISCDFLSGKKALKRNTQQSHSVFYGNVQRLSSSFPPFSVPKEVKTPNKLCTFCQRVYIVCKEGGKNPFVPAKYNSCFLLKGESSVSVTMHKCPFEFLVSVLLMTCHRLQFAVWVVIYSR